MDVPFVILTVAATIVVFLWGGKNLAGRTTVAIA
jgi:nitrogen fixation-related uncharacterized protein